MSISVISIGMLFSCSNSKQDIERITFTEDFPDETTKDATIYYSDSAKIKAILKAPVIDRYAATADPYNEFPEGIDVVFYNDSGTVENTITSNYAKHMVEQKWMEAQTNVIVTNKDGDQLNTEQLIWDQANQTIFSEEFVKITTKEEIIYGDGFESNENFTQYRIKHIKGIISVEEDESVQ